ncbi:MAG: transposase [Acidobacteriia bacterium]|nr:transposase [Terriglobia bacterium]
MARIARVVVPGAWHHATQRGNGQQTVFLGDEDRTFYLALLRRNARRYAVRVMGYCLMGNHVHLVAAPADSEGLSRALGRAHNDYARWLNLRRGTTGHVWQNRFYSCVLDERHGWEALRYVELNPVRAGLVADPAEWPWSSAGAHLKDRDDARLIDLSAWREQWSPASWREALDLGLYDAALVERIREATRTGRPAVDDAALLALERKTGRRLRPGKRGPKPAAVEVGAQLKLGVE